MWGARESSECRVQMGGQLTLQSSLYSLRQAARSGVSTAGAGAAISAGGRRVAPNGRRAAIAGRGAMPTESERHAVSAVSSSTVRESILIRPCFECVCVFCVAFPSSPPHRAPITSPTV